MRLEAAPVPIRKLYKSFGVGKTGEEERINLEDYISVVCENEKGE